jgi:hypothetical protein
MSLRPDLDHHSMRHTTELENIQRLLHFPEEAALLLTKTESEMFTRVSPAYYIRHISVDLTSSKIVAPSHRHPTITDLIHRFKEVSLLLLESHLIDTLCLDYQWYTQVFLWYLGGPQVMAIRVVQLLTLSVPCHFPHTFMVGPHFTNFHTSFMKIGQPIKTLSHFATKRLILWERLTYCWSWSKGWLQLFYWPTSVSRMATGPVFGTPKKGTRLFQAVVAARFNI